MTAGEPPSLETSDGRWSYYRAPKVARSRRRFNIFLSSVLCRAIYKHVTNDLIPR